MGPAVAGGVSTADSDFCNVRRDPVADVMVIGNEVSYRWSMDITRDQVEEYLARYAASLTAFDAEAAAALWSIPGMIVDDRLSGVLDSRAAMVQGLEQSYPIYRRLGLHSVGYELVDENHLTGRLVLVRVRWTFFGAGDELLTDSNAHYLLRSDDGDLRATVCIQTDDAEKLQALAAAHGIDLASPDA